MSKILLHIPHSSSNINYNDFINIEDLKKSINYYTDWYTDELFSSENFPHIKFCFNRHFLDVERFWNDEMEERGLGAIYRKSFFNVLIRNNFDINYIKNIYDKHHSDFAEKAKKIEKKNKEVIIIDCHSFSDDDKKYSDFCIGFNNDATYDSKLIETIKNELNKKGFSVSFNSPYSNSIVPNYDFHNLKSVMIEVNKNLYLNNDLTKKTDFYKIKQCLYDLLNHINLM